MNWFICKQNGYCTRSLVKHQQCQGEYYPESFRPTLDITILHFLTVVIWFKSIVFLIRAMHVPQHFSMHTAVASEQVYSWGGQPMRAQKIF